ncbi:MAG TPA: MopE-related protein [Polyangiales bacterium]|nr:MopE-related protein [Polyangiales bacterium]
MSVILLTDGDDTCTANASTDPPAAAATLFAGDPKGTTPTTKSVRTYVIGFGTGGNFNPNVLNDIASRGGTGSYLAASNERELSAALNQIIADAQPPMETCNGKDDDCDGNADEGIQKFCNLPKNITDKVLCEEPKETNCDGKDDDCDGKIDEGLTNVCGSCGDVPKEVCDGVDNDCDLRIDEDASTLEGCGSDVGECEKGNLVCVMGTERCEGATGKQDEICDCKDNDCDGNIDEEGGGDPLCPGEQRCAGCKCVPFCKPTMEFGQQCAEGLAPDVQPSGECICVKNNCDSTQCAGRSIQQGGDLVCGPNDKSVGTCVCRAGECVSRCVGVTCGNDTVCSPKTGECVENNCRGLGCEANELCDPMSAKCVEDKCKTASCAADEVCRMGSCEKSCGGVTCKSGELCKRGECVDDKCAGKDCIDGAVCDPASGACIADPCSGVACAKGQTCTTESGGCAADACFGVTCPKDQSCVSGECVSKNPTIVQGQEEEPAPTPDRGNRFVAASGGGGCACDVPGPSSGPGSPLKLSVGGLLLLLAATRLGRRRRAARSGAATVRALLGLALACSSSLLTACKVSPLCLDAVCGDAGQSEEPQRGAGSGGDDEPQAGSGGSAGEAAMDAGPDADVDAAMDAEVAKPDAMVMCTPAVETCNAKDDECDLRADEGVVAPTNNCKQQGVCAGTAPVCASGKFTCRYGSDYEMEESRCDGKDNDCDGRVDESFPMLGSSCESGVGACKVSGTRRCNAAGTGLICDLSETKDPGDEVCNGVDDDCDGMIDEPKGTPGTNPSYVHDDFVQIGASLWIYKYEASRADAKDNASGILNARACSRPGVLPWTNLTFEQAKSACEAAGYSLCSRADWLTACRGDSDCDWSSTGCNDYSAQCNGHDVSATPGSPDTDVLKPTGSMPNCYSSFSAGRVFDLSGNAKELTADSNSPAQNPLSGGSYNNAPMGLQCDFDFSVGGPDLHLPNVGFRCCTTSGAP